MEMGVGLKIEYFVKMWNKKCKINDKKTDLQPDKKI